MLDLFVQRFHLQLEMHAVTAVEEGESSRSDSRSGSRSGSRSNSLAFRRSLDSLESSPAWRRPQSGDSKLPEGVSSPLQSRLSSAASPMAMRPRDADIAISSIAFYVTLAKRARYSGRQSQTFPHESSALHEICLNLVGPRIALLPHQHRIWRHQ
jgi:hypothetical protein